MTVTIAPAGSWGIATCTSPATEMPAVLALPGSWPIGLQPQCFVRKDQWAAATTPPGPPVSGYIAWWDASAITGAADNTKLAAWADGSANHNDLAQATGANQPTYYKTTAGKLINGKPAVWFDGAATFMSPVSVTAAQPFTIVVVAQNTSAAATSFVMVGSAAGSYAFYYRSPSPGPAGFAIVATGTLATVGGFDQNLHCFTGVYNDTASFLAMDAVSATPGTSPGTSGLVGTMYVGRTNVGLYWNGPICEIIIYPSALNSTDRAAVASYLKAKWGTP